MAQLTARRGPGEKRRVATKLSEIPDDQLACRAGRHDWPSDKLRPRHPLPRGLHAERQPDRTWVLEDICNRCEKKRWTIIADGIFTALRGWAYIDPKLWVRLDRDLEVSKWDIKGELFGRCADELFR